MKSSIAQVTTELTKHNATMTHSHRFSMERPHLNLQEPFMTFTALLDAAHSVGIDDSPATTKVDAAPASTVSSLINRRLRNRKSCRKTRLKRKLQQHAVDLRVRYRQERKEYLKQLSSQVGVSESNEDVVDRGSRHLDHQKLFRELAVKSLHHALVDPAYNGWQDDDNDQALSCTSTSTTAMKRKSRPSDQTASRRSTRLRRAHDSDVSTAPRRNSATAQTLLAKQWQLVVDGLQNVDLKLQCMEEIDLGAGSYERSCEWKFFGVSSLEVQRDGEITAVAVCGTTRVRFQGVRVQDVNIFEVRRQANAAFDLNSTRTNLDGHVSEDSARFASP